MKKIAIVYASVHHKNTEKIVEVIAKELNADVFEVKDAADVDFGKYQLVGLGSGIYFENIHKSLRAFIENNKSLPKHVFSIVTSGVTSERHKKKVADKLSKQGFRVVDGFACKGHDTYSVFKLVGGLAKGHPDKQDLHNAGVFARKLRESL